MVTTTFTARVTLATSMPTANVPRVPPTCALRVKKGELKFDPDYQLDYEDATGSAINTPWIGLGGDRYVTRVWDPDVALPEFADDFWLGEGLRPRLVDRATGTSKPYADLQDVFDVDGATRIVDGVSYLAISDKQQEPGGFMRRGGASPRRHSAQVPHRGRLPDYTGAFALVIGSRSRV